MRSCRAVKCRHVDDEAVADVGAVEPLEGVVDLLRPDDLAVRGGCSCAQKSSSSLRLDGCRPTVSPRCVAGQRRAGTCSALGWGPAGRLCRGCRRCRVAAGTGARSSFTGTVSMMRSKLDAARAMASASDEASSRSAPRASASASLLAVRLSTVTRAPMRGRELHRHVPEAAEAEHADAAPGADVPQPQRRVHGAARAQERRRAHEVQPARHAQHELLAHDDVLREAALRHLAGDAVDAAERPRRSAVSAELLLALPALIARHARIDHRPDSDRVADLVPRHRAADRDDAPDDLVAGHEPGTSWRPSRCAHSEDRYGRCPSTSPRARHHWHAARAARR